MHTALPTIVALGLFDPRPRALARTLMGVELRIGSTYVTIDSFKNDAEHVNGISGPFYGSRFHSYGTAV